ncbi:unnamed protein product [Symbiodinium sp. CCMP2592]|nr:unnamed protein product [Symbiodinium sp. CCMP2592]
MGAAGRHVEPKQAEEVSRRLEQRLEALSTSLNQCSTGLADARTQSRELVDLRATELKDQLSSLRDSLGGAAQEALNLARRHESLEELTDRRFGEERRELEALKSSDAERQKQLDRLTKALGEQSEARKGVASDLERCQASDRQHADTLRRLETRLEALSASSVQMAEGVAEAKVFAREAAEKAQVQAKELLEQRATELKEQAERRAAEAAAKFQALQAADSEREQRLQELAKAGVEAAAARKGLLAEVEKCQSLDRQLQDELRRVDARLEKVSAVAVQSSEGLAEVKAFAREATDRTAILSKEQLELRSAELKELFERRATETSTKLEVLRAADTERSQALDRLSKVCAEQSEARKGIVADVEHCQSSDRQLEDALKRVDAKVESAASVAAQCTEGVAEVRVFAREAVDKASTQSKELLELRSAELKAQMTRLHEELSKQTSKELQSQSHSLAELSRRTEQRAEALQELLERRCSDNASKVEGLRLADVEQQQQLENVSKACTDMSQAQKGILLELEKSQSAERSLSSWLVVISALGRLSIGRHRFLLLRCAVELIWREGEKEMEVEEVDSPTELAEDSDVGIEPKIEKTEKRKRSDRKRRGRDRLSEVPGSESEESPTKRPLRTDDQPISGRELRALLLDHRQDLKEAWKEFEDRLGKVELCQRKQSGEITSNAGRIKVLEKDVAGAKKTASASEKKVDKLAEEVANLKVQMGEVKQGVSEIAVGHKSAAMEGGNGAGGIGFTALDPWAEYLRRKPEGSGGPAAVPGGSGHLPQGGEVAEGLSDEDKRTLILGGWLQDTRRATIEEESLPLLQHETVRPYLDVEKLAVYGPRRSIGMLKFTQRSDEHSFDEVKSRMWKVVKAVSALKMQIKSAHAMGEEKFFWAAFVKTKTARARSSHISMVRRVCMQLAADSKDAAGGVLNIDHTMVGAYDMDWSAGTIWCGIHKLASATHRSPKDAVTITMSGGWINLDAVGLIVGADTDAETEELAGETCRGPDCPSLLKAQPKVQHGREKTFRCARYRWGRAGTWNLGGQKLDLLDVSGHDLDLVFAQEISRDVEGWDTLDTNCFHWIMHRHTSHWRGVAIGIASDKLDCVIDKRATNRGIWVLARVQGVGRVVLGSIHCHTGATNAIYQAAVIQFARSCPAKWRQYPLLVGSDVNEVPTWFADEAGKGCLASGSSNLNEVAHQLLELGVHPVPPCRSQWSSPTHFPRDSTRKGRQIDMLWSRGCSLSEPVIEADRRHTVGTDHALLMCDIFTETKSSHRWGNDSRPRFMQGDIPKVEICDVDDVVQLARKCSKPRTATSYRDTEKIKLAIVQAKEHKDPKEWKRVHRARRRARRQWEQDRLSNILNGDWLQYRSLQAERTRKKGWWGRMLLERSSRENTAMVQQHLEAKLVNEFGADWDDLLQSQIDCVHIAGEFEDFSMLDAREVLQEMKANSAVGPDGIGVSFLRAAFSDDHVGPQILSLVNHIIRNLELPAQWDKNFLALLAKCDIPARPGDLRPICVSSAFHKMITKMVCRRAMPVMRTGSRISGCGKGRQAADVIGTVGRIRDVTQEWKLGTLLCKLDISGAFDRVDRQKIVEFLKDRLRDHDLDHELRYLLAQLRSYSLEGHVPGGHPISLRPNIGIKQGAPESAEVFGLVMDAILTKLTEHKKWRDFGAIFPGLDLQLVFYQDDIFLVERELSQLAKRINVLERCLAQHGLKLAPEKTKIIASADYRGARKVLVGANTFEVSPSDESIKVLGISFNLQAPASQQAKELLHRTRTAAAIHRNLLRGRASWDKKANMIRTLVESQFAWTGGALHWTSEDLRQANTIQLHTLRSSFRIGKNKGESWQEWNSRSLRLCRAWLAATSRPRWSTSILTLQHTLHGHWARRIETLPSGLSIPSLPLRALMWKCTRWWRNEQMLSDKVGERHPGRFYASNPERQLSDCHGVLWQECAQERHRWTQERQAYIAMWDVKWCKGRQLSIRY